MEENDNLATSEYNVKHYIFLNKMVHTYSNRTEYFNNKGEKHREDGPAVEWNHGDKYYYKNGLLHRIDGPAIDRINGTKMYYVNGLKHRIGGPAVIGGSKTIADSVGKDSYWICGIEYTEEQYKKLLDIK